MQKISSKTRQLLWHGTGSDRLRQILKQGLVPVAAKKFEKGWEEDFSGRSSRPYGGIYVSNDLSESSIYGERARRRGKNAVYVGIDYDLRSGGAWLDEDTLFSPVINTLDLWTTSSLTREGSWFFENFLKPSGAYDAMEPGSIDPRFYMDLVEIVVNADYTDKAKEALRALGEEFPELIKKMSRSKFAKQILFTMEDLIRKYILHLLEQHAKSTRSEFEEYIPWELENAEPGSSEEKVLRERLDALGSIPAPMQNTHAKLVKVTKNLGKLTQGIAARSSRSFFNMRLMEPVNYRGKNRIVFVAEVRPDDALVVRYMASKGYVQRFMDEYRREVGPLRKALVKKQTIMRQAAELKRREERMRRLRQAGAVSLKQVLEAEEGVKDLGLSSVSWGGYIFTTGRPVVFYSVLGDFEKKGPIRIGGAAIQISKKGEEDAVEVRFKRPLVLNWGGRSSTNWLRRLFRFMGSKFRGSALSRELYRRFRVDGIVVVKRKRPIGAVDLLPSLEPISQEEVEEEREEPFETPPLQEEDFQTRTSVVASRRRKAVQRLNQVYLRLASGRLFHTTSAENLLKILKTKKILPGGDQYAEHAFVSLSEIPFTGDISHNDVIIVFRPGSSITSQVMPVKYTESWYDQHPEHAAYIAGEGWREMYEPPEWLYEPPEDLDEDELDWWEPDEEDVAAAEREAELDSFLFKSDEKEWISKKEYAPVKFNLDDVAGVLLIKDSLAPRVQKLFNERGYDIPVASLKDGVKALRTAFAGIR